jgi:hypothetical protein
MRTQRLLFAREPFAASLAPVYAALLTIVALSLAGFAIAFWPDDARPDPGRSGQAAAEASPTRIHDGGRQLLHDRRVPRSRMKEL